MKKSKKIKVILVTPTLQYGGAEQQLSLLASKLDKDKFEVKVYCIYDVGPYGDELANKGVKVVGGRNLFILPWLVFQSLKRALIGNRNRNNGNNRNVSSESLRKSHLASFIRNIRKLNQILDDLLYSLSLVDIWFTLVREKPDIVHAYQDYAKISLLAAKVAGCKSVFYTEVSIIEDRLSEIQRRILALYLRLATKIIAMSEAIKVGLIKENIPAEKIEIIPPMIDLGLFQVAQVDSGKNVASDLNLGVVARLVEIKGHRYLLEAMEVITERFPKVKLIIAGNGILKGELEDYTNTLKIRERVEFVGNFDNLASVMSLFEIFVLPSLSEGMPVSILEAMAYGKAIVATNVGGLPEEVVDGETGILVPPGDAKALAEAICKLLADPQMVYQMGKAGQERVNKIFSTEAVTRRIEEFYEKSFKGNNLEIPLQL